MTYIVVWLHTLCETTALSLQQSIVAVFSLGDCPQAHKAVERAAGAVSDTGALGQPARQSLQARQRALQQLQTGTQLPGGSRLLATCATQTAIASACCAYGVGHPGTCAQCVWCLIASARMQGHSCLHGSPDCIGCNPGSLLPAGLPRLLPGRSQMSAALEYRPASSETSPGSHIPTSRR